MLADAILIVATNPVDIMTDVTCRLAALPAGRVFGTVHAYVLGEHGDRKCSSGRALRLGACPLTEFAAPIGRPLRQE